jgi:hypothetical protein
MLTGDNVIKPDLTIEPEPRDTSAEGSSMETNSTTPDIDDDNAIYCDLQDVSPDQLAKVDGARKPDQQYGRGQRKTTTRQFLLPGTGLPSKVTFLEPLPKPQDTEFQIRDLQYANPSFHVTNCDHPMFLMACIESQCDEDVRLNKELELLMACSAMKDNLPLEPVNLSIPDPKSQRDINRMQPTDAKRFNDATLAEVDGTV